MTRPVSRPPLHDTDPRTGPGYRKDVRPTPRLIAPPPGSHKRRTGKHYGGQLRANRRRVPFTIGFTLQRVATPFPSPAALVGRDWTLLVKDHTTPAGHLRLSGSPSPLARPPRRPSTVPSPPARPGRVARGPRGTRCVGADRSLAVPTLTRPTPEVVLVGHLPDPSPNLRDLGQGTGVGSSPEEAEVHRSPGRPGGSRVGGRPPRKEIGGPLRVHGGRGVCRDGGRGRDAARQTRPQGVEPSPRGVGTKLRTATILLGEGTSRPGRPLRRDLGGGGWAGPNCQGRSPRETGGASGSLLLRGLSNPALRPPGPESRVVAPRTTCSRRERVPPRPPPPGTPPVTGLPWCRAGGAGRGGRETFRKVGPRPSR